jgi:hypothetical protein
VPTDWLGLIMTSLAPARVSQVILSTTVAYCRLRSRMDRILFPSVFPHRPPRLTVDPTRPTLFFSLAPPRPPIPIPSQSQSQTTTFYSTAGPALTFEDVGLPVTSGRWVARSWDRNRGAWSVSYRREQRSVYYNNPIYYTYYNNVI